DLLVDARWVIPVEPSVVLENHAVAIDDGRILAVLPSIDATRIYEAKTRYSLKNHVLIPGLVNLHTHAAMTLMRGMADDIPLMEWLSDHIWPVEKLHMGQEFVHDGTKLACAEMMKGGTTAFNDMYFFPGSAAQAVLESGMRAAIGMVVLDFATPYAADCDDYISKGLEVRDQYGSNAMLSFFFAPHAPYTVSDKSFSKILTYAEELDLPIHIHLNETKDEVKGSIEQHGVNPVSRLSRLGLLGPNLIAVHMVHSSSEEIDLLANRGCHVAHCPASNLKLASGFAPVLDMMDAGINVGLGTDGAASNNRSDMFAEMRLAALLAKGMSGRADALPAKTVLEMATLNGARALGLDHEIGSLLPGKSADMVAVDMTGSEISPIYDPLSHLVYATGREHVSHVWIGGEIRISDGELVSLDEPALVAKAAWWKERIAKGELT
ncbi:MAG TPA: TRZ/ATZ family hydrolase, partial [Burkholderiales bacterium]|nr:TRZ/ATZ family hydrolase [Burkholderiales bacterium]